MKLVVATRNRGKFREFRQMLTGHELVPLWEFSDIPDLEEDGSTFRENAMGKARAVFQRTGLPTLADDSGLVVDLLDGRPGVLSARYAGDGATDDQNLKKVLFELHTKQGTRSARYVCAMALSLPDGSERVVEESCEGEIVSEPRGTGGFGYDPIFLIPHLGKTMAEIPPSIKNSISHRGKAIRRLNYYLS